MTGNNYSLMDIAIDDSEIDLVETVAGASMDIDLNHFDPSDPEEMMLRALDDMIPEELSERPIDDKDDEE